MTAQPSPEPKAPMRALLYADAMNPAFASEPGVTFNTARALVDQLDEAVVVTQVRNREAIDKVGMGSAEVVYLDTEYIARPIWKVSKALRLNTANLAAIKYPVQVAFERALWKRFGSDLTAGRFDILHRLGPISSALPSPLTSWSPVPVVVGPVNGGLPYPPAFRGLIRREGEWLRHVRNAYRLLPYTTSTYTRAAAILAAFDHTINTLPPGNGDRVFDVPEVGADPALFATRSEPNKGKKTRVDFFFAGRLVPFKCADVAIRAFADSEILRQHHLTIAGDGPERAMLEALVAEHDLSACVTFLGWTEKQVVADHMHASDVFVFPSIRDAGAGVIVEAMMSGLTTIAVGYGPGQHLLDDSCGVRVPLGTREDHVAGFRAAMEHLAQDPAACARMGQAARARAMARLSWEARARYMIDVYAWVLDQRAEKPGGLMDQAGSVAT